MSRPLTLTIPRKGRIRKQTEDFFEANGLTILPNERQPFLATIKEINNLNVRYRNAIEIAEAYWGGDLDVGITGLDLLQETGAGAKPETYIELGYSRAELHAIAKEFPIITKRAHNHKVWIGTKYPNLTKLWWEKRAEEVCYYAFKPPIKITNFLQSKTTYDIEESLTRGYLDFAVDIVASGKTIRENSLRTPPRPPIMKTQAVLCYMNDLDRKKARTLANLCAALKIIGK